MSNTQRGFATRPITADSEAEPTGPSESARFDAIVLAGGRGSRLGGIDKAAILLQGAPMVDRCIDAARSFGAERVIVAGPVSVSGRADVQVREDPPFSGPLAALDASIREAHAPWVMVLACDLVSPTEVITQLSRALRATPDHIEGTLLQDEQGFPQWLASAFRTDLLLAALAQYRAETGTFENASLRAVFQKLRLEMVTARPGSTDDIDTPEQLSRARKREITTETEAS